MKAMPEVDVVILSWNRLTDTLAAIDSVLGQNVDSVSLWVVDQGSRPQQIVTLREVSAKNPEIHLIELPSNVGVPAGRNIGIKSGKADFVVCLDNDAVFDSSNALASAVERLASDHRLGAVAFRSLDFETGALDLDSWIYPRVYQQVSEPVPVTRFVGVGHALRRAAFVEAGGYDGTLFFCEEELDLSYRMIDRGYWIVYDPSIVVLHKRSPEERMTWEEGRTYHQVRNAILVHHRYQGRLGRSALLATGWLIRGLYNGQGHQAAQGIRDAFRLLRSEDDRSTLSSESQQYVRKYDTRLRGSLLNRMRHEVLMPFPTGETGRVPQP